MIEEGSATWIKVREWAESELQKTRDKLESPACTDDMARHYRGRIEQLKDLLRLPASLRKRSSQPKEE